ncbi:DUF397 domain-containing protein [Micromonospora taraxaci]
MDILNRQWAQVDQVRRQRRSCVEVADNLAHVVLVCDTKDRDGGTLHVDPAAWKAFIAYAKQH